jgi:hypothetical protein
MASSSLIEFLSKKAVRQWIVIACTWQKGNCSWVCVTQQQLTMGLFLNGCLLRALHNTLAHEPARMVLFDRATAV